MSSIGVDTYEEMNFFCVCVYRESFVFYVSVVHAWRYEQHWFGYISRGECVRSFCVCSLCVFMMLICHVHKLGQAQTHIHTQTQTYIHTKTHIHKHTHIHKKTHTNPGLTYIRPRAQTNTHTSTHIHKNTHTHTQNPRYDVYTTSCTNTHIHKHTHTHTHTNPGPKYLRPRAQTSAKFSRERMRLLFRALPAHSIHSKPPKCACDSTRTHTRVDLSYVRQRYGKPSRRHACRISHSTLTSGRTAVESESENSRKYFSSWRECVAERTCA